MMQLRSVSPNWASDRKCVAKTELMETHMKRKFGRNLRRQSGALALALVSCLFANCAGYQLGGAKPSALAEVRSVAVPMFSNMTLHPRAESIATSAVVSAMTQDGTYRVSSRDEADAVLIGSVASIQYSTLRSSRMDSLLPEELQNKVTLDWTLVDSRDATRVLAQGSSTGTSQLFVDANLQSARNNALPDALERAGQALIGRIANGY